MGAFALRVEIAALAALAGEAALPGALALEVGCGTARFAGAFAQRGLRMIGVDRSMPMLGAAARRLPGALCCGAGERLPFPAASFDAALAVTVLEFLTDTPALLAEMWRVLRPGGRLTVGVLNAWSPWALARRSRGDETPYAQAHFFTPPELVRLLRAFGPVDWRGAVYLPPTAEGAARTWWSAVESIGARLMPMFGAFLAAVVQKPWPCCGLK